MNDAKQYEAMAASEFDLRREVVRLRSINKDLLEACEAAQAFIGTTREYTSGHTGAANIVRECAAAIRKAEGR